MTPYRDGTTHIVLEPLDFIGRLAALVPPPRMHLTRYHAAHPCAAPLRGSLRLCKSAVLPICHGVFAPHSKLRAAVTPAHRGQGAAQYAAADPAQPPMPRHVAMSWARRLRRVFGIQIEHCAGRGGTLRIIASIEEPEPYPSVLPLGARALPRPQQGTLL